MKRMSICGEFVMFQCSRKTLFEYKMYSVYKANKGNLNESMYDGETFCFGHSLNTVILFNLDVSYLLLRLQIDFLQRAFFHLLNN